MAYSTDDDLFERMDQELVVQLTDDDNTGSIDQTVLTDKRSTCAELVDSHLRGRYDLPMNNPPDLLADIEADLLVDKLYSRRANIEKPESVKADQKEAMKLLMAISKGDIELEDQQGPEGYSIQTNKDADDRKFPDSKWDRF